MYPVTTDFLDKMKADRRRVLARVEVDYTDPFLDQSIEVITSENANVSFPSQTADAVAEPFAKIASLDGSWVLDGTYTLATGKEEDQMGWWGKQLAGPGGRFSCPLESTPGGNYVQYDGATYLKLTGATRRVMDLEVSGMSTWEANPNWPTKVELEGDDWTDEKRAIDYIYWTSTEKDANWAWAVIYLGPIITGHKGDSTYTRLCQELPESLYVIGGSGTLENPYILQQSPSPSYPTLTVSFFPRPITRLQAVGDSKRQEWPVDFNIKLYDSNNILLHTEAVTGNTEIAWSKVLDEPVTQVEKMELEITKWSHAGRQAKILEFFTSIQEVYEGDDIILVHLLEEREVSQGSLPVGNISANEIDIRLNNETRKFDAGNKVSSLYQLLKANRRIKAWIGTEGELVPLGVFWSGDWNVPEDNVYAATTGRDRLELLRKSTYSTSKVEQDTTLYELAEIVLQDAGLTEDEYWIDGELQEHQIPYAYFTIQSHREALRKIAEACLGQCYCDREGILRIEGSSFMEDKITELTDTYFLEGAFPAEVGGIIEAYGIGPDDYFRKDNPVKWSEIANHIEVETQPLRPDAEQEVYRSNEPVSITAGQKQTITAYYNHTPCIEATATLENAVSGAEITKAIYYAWGADITVYSANTGTFELVINAKPLKVLNKEKAIAQDDASIADNGVLKYTLPANPLVQTREVAQRIADTLLAYFKDPRRDIEIDWRGNPALLLGDIILTPDYQRSGEDQRGLFYVTKQELEYDGGLRATLEGRRVL